MSEMEQEYGDNFSVELHIRVPEAISETTLENYTDDIFDALEGMDKGFDIHLISGNFINEDDDEESTVYDDVDELEERVAQLEKTFRHCHENNQKDDACKRCGLDLRDGIHLRIKESGK